MNRRGRKGADPRSGGPRRPRPSSSPTAPGQGAPRDRNQRLRRAQKEKETRRKADLLPVVRRTFPVVAPGPTGPPLPGEWLYTTRAEAEIDLIEELAFLDEKSRPRPAGGGLVAALAAPRQSPSALTELAFARQGFPVGSVEAPAALTPAVRRALESRARPTPWAFDVWVPDTDEGNRRSAEAQALASSLDARALGPWASLRATDARGAFADNGLYAQACLLPSGAAAVGALWARDAPSLAPGGRLRVHVADAAPSRAAMKLVEAFTWLDRSPEPNDLCVDLGAAPGGWSWVLLERRARVIAVDPGPLARNLIGRKGLTHLRGDAFRFEPEEPADWLFCDMAWRPLEAAGLLAKWARRRWARLLVANLKLPMRKKAEYYLRVRDILEDAGWTSLRARQLYHDRDEVTVAGVRLK